MFEKVNPSHPDKMADRLAGAIVDMAYAKSENPKIAVEVLAGHGLVTVIIETSLSEEQLNRAAIDDAIMRIFDIKDVAEMPMTMVKIVQQDAHLAANQRGAVRCGDNGIFKGCPVTEEQKLLTDIAASIYHRWPYDGKYLVIDSRMREVIGHGGEDTVYELTTCQSHARRDELEAHLDKVLIANIERCDGIADIAYRTNYVNKINPLGPWTGGPCVDCGATNRKLGSDMGDGVTGGGLHGKDLSKADVSVNIYCHLLAQREHRTVCASCSIGDTDISFKFGSCLFSLPYEYVVESARRYITDLGGFEKFAEWGLIRPIEN